MLEIGRIKALKITSTVTNLTSMSLLFEKKKKNCNPHCVLTAHRPYAPLYKYSGKVQNHGFFLDDLVFVNFPSNAYSSCDIVEFVCNPLHIMTAWKRPGEDGSVYPMSSSSPLYQRAWGIWPGSSFPLLIPGHELDGLAHIHSCIYDASVILDLCLEMWPELQVIYWIEAQTPLYRARWSCTS